VTRFKKLSPVLWGLAAAVLAFSLGAYGEAVASGERAGFVMNFPATGTECGGPSMRDLTGEIVIETDGAGLVKRILQPRTLELVSHVVRNVGDVPQRIRFEVQGLPADIELELGSRDLAWNPETHEIERDIAPGEAVDFDVLMHLPAQIPFSSMPLRGQVVIFDASSGQVLSTLPVSLVRTGAVGGGSCCD